MATKQMWCSTCNIVVAAVVETGISKIVVPVIGTALGGLIGMASGEDERDAPKRALLGALLGAAVSAAGHAIVREAVPAAQRLVCGSCGCEHLVAHAA